MERVGTLINKLKEQFEQQAGTEKLAVTAQLLLAELQKSHVQPSVPGKISVVLPKVSGHHHPAITEEKEEPVKAVEVPSVKKEPLKQEPVMNSWLFETPAEIPTLAHQEEVVANTVVTKEPAKRIEKTPVVEFNNSFAPHGESLNEKLKEEKLEVATALQGTPIRDLKKAIGINDRFLFVNDLFRGDENMYERSLKTINGFTIYPEAEYWIQRELKVKLSWPDNSETVKLFDQLIKRRFS
jgi:hypothetical protein